MKWYGIGRRENLHYPADAEIHGDQQISLSNYIAARKCFYQKYGYYPIKVPVYGLDGLDILRFEKGGSYNDQC